MPLMISPKHALEAAGLAALFQLSLLAVIDQLGQFGLEALQDERDVVDVLLHLLVVAVVGLGDQLIDLAGGDLARGCGCPRRSAAGWHRASG